MGKGSERFQTVQGSLDMLVSLFLIGLTVVICGRVDEHHQWLHVVVN
jgi:hypothetical protein